MTTTYSLAIAEDMLLATVPDGFDIAAAVEAECAKSGIDVPEYRVTAGCSLTDDEPADNDLIIVWNSGNGGWIIDEEGNDWRYAIRRIAA